MFQIIGQEHVKERIGILIEYSKITNKRLPDLFFSGPGGVGKSTFARAVAKLSGCVSENDELAYAELNAASLRSFQELLDYLAINCKLKLKVDAKTNKVLIPKCLIFIDEAQKLSGSLMTEFLNAMDEKRITTFKSPKRKEVMTADFTNVTFIMASTDKNDLTDAFLSRFQIFELKPYDPEEIAKAVQFKTNWPFETALEVGKRAKSIMRTAMLDIENIKAYLTVKKLEATPDNVTKYYEKLKKVDDLGLDIVDFEILQTLEEAGCPLGLKVIAARLGKSENEVENREGFMAAQGLINKVSGGRAISEDGKKRLKENYLVVSG